MTDATLATAPSAVIFDCDGTVADTEPMTARVFDLVLARYGAQLVDGDLEQIIGRTLDQNHAHLSQRIELPAYRDFSEEWYEVSYALLDAELTLFDDSVEVLHHVAQAGIPVGMASSSPREHVRRVLRHGDLGAHIQAVVAFEDVGSHKPDPAPYLRAAQLLGVDPGTAVAVEDTSVGVAAARAAGMYCVGVVRTGIDPETLAAADVVVDRITVDHVLTRPGPGTPATAAGR